MKKDKTKTQSSGHDNKLQTQKSNEQFIFSSAAYYSRIFADMQGNTSFVNYKIRTQGERQNFNFPSPGSEKVMFNKSKIHQWGIFSAAPFNNGEPIIEFHGKITNSPGTKSYKIDEKNYFDPTGSGSLARYVNHSCNPNCILKIVNISGRQAVYLYSRQYIRPSEELCIDYKLPPCNKSDAIPCNCGSSNCRKYINNYEFVKKSGRQKQRKKEPHDVIQRPKEARLLFSSIHQLCPSIKMDQDLLQDYLMISDIDDQEEEEHSERNEQQTPQTKKTGKNAHNSKKKSESVEPNNKEKDKKKTSEKQKKETKAQETEKSRKRKTENEAETREKEKVKNPNQTKKEKVKKSKENETENKAQKQRGRTKRVANSPEPKENEVPKKNAKNTKNANNKKLKKEEEKSKEIPVAKLYDNFLRNVMPVQMHFTFGGGEFDPSLLSESEESVNENENE